MTLLIEPANRLEIEGKRALFHKVSKRIEQSRYVLNIAHATLVIVHALPPRLRIVGQERADDLHDVTELLESQAQAVNAGRLHRIDLVVGLGRAGEESVHGPEQARRKGLVPRQLH